VHSLSPFFSFIFTPAIRAPELGEMGEGTFHIQSISSLFDPMPPAFPVDLASGYWVETTSGFLILYFFGTHS
jgi:hypothetical protein